MDKIKKVYEKYMKKGNPSFKVGDTVVVYVKIKEEGKTRLQAFEGVVIRRKGRDIGENFTVRRVSYGEGVERTFPLHSPLVDRIEIRKKGLVKKAKLYYLREKKGKKSKIAEKVIRETEPSQPETAPSGEQTA